MASRTIRFENGFNGELLLDEGSVKIGRAPGGAAPYDMLYGALASCLYSTFLGILEKKRIEIEGTEIVVEGEKRTEVPKMCIRDRCRSTSLDASRNNTRTSMSSPSKALRNSGKSLADVASAR